jgi:uncharacterized membrane protein YtjA (UPF0391 family)
VRLAQWPALVSTLLPACGFPAEPGGCRCVIQPFTLNVAEIAMIGWAVTFLVIALVAGLFGFGVIASTSVGFAKILFFVFLVLFVLSLVFPSIRGRF